MTLYDEEGKARYGIETVKDQERRDAQLTEGRQSKCLNETPANAS